MGTLVERVALSFTLGLLYAFASGNWKIAILCLFPLFYEQSFRAVMRISAAFYMPALLPIYIASADFTGDLLIAFFAYIIALSLSIAAISLFFGFGQKTPLFIGFFVCFWSSPFAMFSFASPLWLSGVLFPGFGFLGIGLLVVLIAVLRYKPIIGVSVLSFCIVLSAMATEDNTYAAATGVSLHRNFESSNDLVNILKSRKSDISLARSATTHTVIFPESTFGTWHPEVHRLFETENKTIIGGQNVYTDAQPTTHIKTAVDMTTGEIIYQQRKPVPTLIVTDGEIPIATDDPHGVVDLDGKNIGFLICWESFDLPTLYQTIRAKPDFAVLMANTYWSMRYPMGRVMEQHFQAWMDLFDVPTVIAVNRYV